MKRAALVGCLGAAAAIVFGAMAASPAAAEEEGATIPLRIVVTIPEACRGSFADGITGRSRLVKIVADGARVARVKVEAGPSGGFQGRLDLTNEGAVATREIAGATCDEVLDGLALIAAIALDPNTRTTRSQDDGGNEGGEAGDGGIAPTGSAGISEGGTTERSDAADATTDAAPPSNTGLQWLVGATGEVQAIAPDPVLGAGAFVAVKKTNGSMWWPEFRLGIVLTAMLRVDSAAGTGRFNWVKGWVEACVPRALTIDFTGLSLRLCPGLEVGTIRARGSGPNVTAQEEVRGWLAARLPVSVQLLTKRGFGAEIEGGALVPFTREEFALAPAPALYRSPAVFAFAAAHLFVAF